MGGGTTSTASTVGGLSQISLLPAISKRKTGDKDTDDESETHLEEQGEAKLRGLKAGGRGQVDNSSGSESKRKRIVPFPLTPNTVIVPWIAGILDQVVDGRQGGKTDQYHKSAEGNLSLEVNIGRDAVESSLKSTDNDMGEEHIHPNKHGHQHAHQMQHTQEQLHEQHSHIPHEDEDENENRDRYKSDTGSQEVMGEGYVQTSGPRLEIVNNSVVLMGWTVLVCVMGILAIAPAG